MGNCETIDEQKIHLPRQGPVSELLITNSVWSRKYLGLYDFQSQESTKRKLRVEGGAVVMKEGEKLILVDEQLDRLTKGKAEHLRMSIFKLTRSDNYYQLAPIVYEEKGELVQRPLWLVVRSLPNKVYTLREKDVIKLGKQKLKVREVVPADINTSAIIPNRGEIKLRKAVYDNLALKETTSEQGGEHLRQGQLEKELKKEAMLPQEKQGGKLEVPIESTKTIGLSESIMFADPETCQDICRICLQPGLTTNPLITPCKCTGTVRYIHLLCLKQWLSKQIKAVVNDFSVTINWKPLLCEMCKAHYKYRIYLDNQKFYTVDIPKPERPYIVLEMMRKKGGEEGKIFKFITFRNKQQINIGRKKDVDVRISEDISVSRIHAILKYRQETREFILEDNHSKFGTLVLAKNGLLLRPHHMGITLQIGAELFEFQTLREATAMRMANFDMGEQYLREEVQEDSDEEDNAASEEEDEVMELPADDGDRSPHHPHSHSQRSPSMRRSQSMQSSSHTHAEQP